MPDIFLSYSRSDQVTARRVAEALERAGFSVWWDQTLNAGEAYDKVTETALKQARAVVVLWSKTSVESRWVRTEATIAHRNDTLVPVMIEPCERPIMFELTQTSDLSHWKGDANDKAWLAYVESVRRFVERDATRIAPPASPPATRKRSTSAAALALIIGGLVLVGGGTWMLVSNGNGTNGRTNATAPAASVAVLPFKNMSADKDQEYFADGITEEILNSLAGLHDLKVTGRTSSFAYKGKDIDLRTIGETLGVKNILEGSIRKSGNNLRITAQLNDAKTGYHLWSKTYDRPMDDIFKIQEDIATSVAQALQISLGVGELGTRPGMTRNVEAYDAYLASISFMEPSPDSIRSGMTLLERATTLDPSFVDAWVRLANVYAFASTVSLPGNTQKGWAAKADAVIARLNGISEYGQIVFEGLSGDRSQNALAMVDAQKHFENARALAQKLGLQVDVGGNDAIFVLATGRFAEAITLLERDKARDPLNTFVRFLLAHAHASRGDLPAAIAEVDRGMKIGGYQIPLNGVAVVTALATHDRRQIEQRLEMALDADSDPEGLNAAMKLRLDKSPEALSELRRRAAASTSQVGLSTIAIWTAWFGDPAGALEIYRTHLEYFRSARRSAIVFDIWSPVMRDMRKLPGFKDLAREMGLVDYWRTYGWGDLCKPVGTNDFECQ
jgi:TolB-like protein/tetratricopeptide (TPR) repeat protein